MYDGPLRVMVVDDSPVVRRALLEALGGVPGLEVVSSAPNGRIALRKISASPPDVCVLDLEMPEMDGEELLGHLRADFPATRVLILTAHGDRATSRAVQALMMGASDMVLKPVATPGGASGVTLLRELLVPKLLQFRAPAQRHVIPTALPGKGSWQPRALVIGVSTGGPEALTRLVPALPADFPLPVLIVQHMPPGFTRSLAERLDRVSALDVREAVPHAKVEPGTVWIAPGGQHMLVSRRNDAVYLRLDDGPPENSCRPSVDTLFRSAGAVWGGDLLALVLTGMGADGAYCAGVLKELGAYVLVQDRASSVVWGMPGAVVERGAANEVLPLDHISPRLIALAARGATARNG
jgi:two-component system chemotaxis response regulator CheB